MKACRKVNQICSREKQTILMLLGVLFGAVAGYSASSLRKFSTREVMHVAFPGRIFIRILEMIAVPLLVCCIVSALADLQRGMSSKMILQYLVITLFMSVEGTLLTFTLALAIRPGISGEDAPHNLLEFSCITLQDIVLDLGRNLVPKNPLGMFKQSYRTALRNDTSCGQKQEAEGESLQSENMAGIVVVSVVLGIVMKQLGDEVAFLKDLVDCIASMTFLWLKWVMFMSPLFLCSLVGAEVLQLGIPTLIGRSVWYTVTFLSYHSVQLLIMYPLAFFVLTRKNPFRYYSIKVILTALGTSSSLATLPIAIAFLEEKCHFDSKMVRVFLSIGINISNQLGNLMTLCGMSIFMAQTNNMALDFILILKIVVYSIPTSIAIPGVPCGVIASLIALLGECGIPNNDVGLVLSMEWLNDRFVTTINVLGNVLVVAMMANFYKEVFLPQKTQVTLE